MSDERVPKGYKNTEVGVIPEDWETLKLKDIAPLQRGFDLPTSQLKKGDYPVVYSNGVMSYHAEFMAKGPGVITGRSGTIGNVHYVLGNYWPHNTTLWVTSFINSYPKYVYYLYQSVKFERFGTGSGVPTLNRNDIHSLKIPLPPLPEQKAIATTLSNIDNLITALDKLIGKKRDIKAATMQQLLTGKKRLPGFGEGKGYKNSEVGVIPEDWEAVTLGEYAEVTKLAGFEYTNYFNSYRDGGEIIVIRGVNITQNVLNLENVKTIPKATSSKLSRSQLKKDDLVFAYVGTIGPVYLIEQSDKYHLGPNTARITCKKEIVPKFLFLYFKSSFLQLEIDEKVSVGAQPSLSMAKIRSFRIIKPPLPEQKAIATILSNQDEEITALEKRLAKTKAIKQGMMQELLTGKTRLINN